MFDVAVWRKKSKHYFISVFIVSILSIFMSLTLVCTACVTFSFSFSLDCSVCLVQNTCQHQSGNILLQQQEMFEEGKKKTVFVNNYFKMYFYSVG